MFIDTFRQDSDGAFLAFVRDEDRRLAQVVAAPQPGPSYWYMKAPEKELGLIGNRGGGKTHTMILRILSGIGRGWGPHYNTVLLRSSLREMTDLVMMINEIVNPIWGKSVTFNKLAHVWEWKSGERLELNYYIDDTSFGLYQGKSFALVAFEELSLQKNLDGYMKMFSTLRSALPESVMPRHMLFTANPGGPSHNAIKHRFQLSGIPPAVGPCIVDENGESRRAFNCNYEDNALLRRSDPRYMLTIEQSCEGDPPRLQSWKFGNWDIVAGGALDDVFFKYGKYIYVEPFEIPAMWRTFASYDHGSSRPYAWLAWAESDGTDLMSKSGRVMSTRPGDLFLVGEVYGNLHGEPDKGSRESVAEITTRVQQYKINMGWRFPDVLQPNKWHDMFKRGFADSAIWQENNEFCIADEFREPVMINGVRHPGLNFEPVSKPPGSRETGFALVRERLINCAPRPDSKMREGKGLFIVRDLCPNTVRTLPTLQRNPKNMDDVDPASESHIWDSIRYALQADRSPHISTRRRYYA